MDLRTVVRGMKQEAPFLLLSESREGEFTTEDTPKERELQVFGDPLEAFWKKYIFDFCGVKTFYRRMFGVIVTSTFEERLNWLKEVEDTVNVFPRTSVCPLFNRFSLIFRVSF